MVQGEWACGIGIVLFRVQWLRVDKVYRCRAPAAPVYGLGVTV